MKRAAGALMVASISLCLSPLAQATTATTTTTEWLPPSREHAPDTDACPQATWPPEPVSTSERAASSPTPLAATYDGPCGITAADGYNVPEEVVASAWLVADLDTGDVVAMKDPHGRYRPASIIKVLLALVVIEELPLDDAVDVSTESANQEGSAAGIGAGGQYTVRDLLYGLILNSGNDCAHALAQKLGGDEVALSKVNALAAELGMTDTRAASYSGLDAAGMSTSAWDMGLAYREAFTNPVFAEIADTESYDFPGFDELPGFKLWNDNHLYLYDPDGIGGKTGYTDDANHTFVGAVDHDGRRLLAVVLDTTAWDHGAWQQAQMLLHAAYPISPAASVANLNAPAAEPSPEPSPTTTPAPVTEEPEKETATGPRETWLPVAIVAGVAVLAALAAWLSRRLGGLGRR
ncbi:serine hydrolase [Corynebacterium sp. Q4381]|uniref:serine hydrolase n=1 Tax=Corynebacterium sp. Marseille-Q4381 TaxID=3121597 RepID=UPI002FE61300